MDNLPNNSKDESVIIRDRGGRFVAGHVPPGGRPVGSLGGRANALKWLDAIINEREVKEAIQAAIRKEALEHSLRFFKQIIMPLLPQDVKVKLGEEGAMSWVRISTMYPTADSLPSTPADPFDSARSVAGDAGERLYASLPNCSIGPEERPPEIMAGLPQRTLSPSAE